MLDEIAESNDEDDREKEKEKKNPYTAEGTNMPEAFCSESIKQITHFHFENVDLFQREKEILLLLLLDDDNFRVLLVK